MSIVYSIKTESVAADHILSENISIININ